MLYSWKAVFTVCNMCATYCLPISGLYALYGIYEIQFSEERRRRYVRKDQDIDKIIPSSCNKLQQTPSDSMIKENIDSPNTDDSKKQNNGKLEKNTGDCFSNEKRGNNSKDSTLDSSNHNQKSPLIGLQDSTPKSKKTYRYSIFNEKPKDKHMLDMSDEVLLLNGQLINLVGTVLTDKNKEDTDKINCQTEIMIRSLGKDKQLTLIDVVFPNYNGRIKQLVHFIQGLFAVELNLPRMDECFKFAIQCHTFMNRTIEYLGNELAKCAEDPSLEYMQYIITVISTGARVKQGTSPRTSDNPRDIYVYGNAIPPSKGEVRINQIMHLLDNCKCPYMEGKSKLAFVKVYRRGNNVTMVHKIFDIIQNQDVLDITRLLITPSCEQRVSYFTVIPEMVTWPRNANGINYHSKDIYLPLTSNKMSKFESRQSDKDMCLKS